MTTTQPTTQPAPTPAVPALTPTDRQLLAWYLGSRIDRAEILLPNLDPAAVERWAASPAIAPQIAAFHRHNDLATRCIRAANYYDAQVVVGEDLRTAATSTQRLRAVNAFIRLSNSRNARPARDTGSSTTDTGSSTDATASPRRAPSSAPPSTHAPQIQRDPAVALPPLPPLPNVAPSPPSPSASVPSPSGRGQGEGPTSTPLAVCATTAAPAPSAPTASAPSPSEGAQGEGPTSAPRAVCATDHTAQPQPHSPATPVPISTPVANPAIPNPGITVSGFVPPTTSAPHPVTPTTLANAGSATENPGALIGAEP